MMPGFRRLRETLRPYADIGSVRSAYRYVMPYIKAHRKYYYGLLALLLADIVFTLLFARFFGQLTDAAMRSDWKRLAVYAGAGTGLVLLRLIVTYVQEICENGAVAGVTRDAKTELYRRILLLPAEQASRLASGRLHAHFSHDVDGIEAMIGRNAVELIRVPLMYAVVFLYLSHLSASLSALALLAAPAAAAAGAAMGLVLRRNNRLIHQAIGSISELLNETFRGLPVIRAFTLESRFFRQFAGRSRELHELLGSNARLRGLFYAGGGALSSVIFLLSLIMGAYYVSQGRMTVGTLLTYVSLVHYLVDPLTGLASLWAGIQRSVTAVERLADVMSIAPGSAELPDTSAAARPVGSVEFRRVRFGYDDSRAVIKDFSLRIESGMTVAIVGPSGAGKTTLFRLLLGEAAPQSGTVALDGVPVQELQPAELRRVTACVPQDPFLFSGTVRENLMLARPGITDEEMKQAAEMAQLHEFILSLPKGYDTHLGENGAQLSGGQQQRLCIARALLRGAPILLLDEATSALDGVTEALVKEALDRSGGSRITLVVAHRLSTVRNADLIVVMQDGRIAEKGTHDGLMRANRLYAELVRSQTAHDDRPSSLNAPAASL